MTTANLDNDLADARAKHNAHNDALEALAVANPDWATRYRSMKETALLRPFCEIQYGSEGEPIGEHCQLWTEDDFRQKLINGTHRYNSTTGMLETIE